MPRERGTWSHCQRARWGSVGRTGRGTMLMSKGWGEDAVPQIATSLLSLNPASLPDFAPVVGNRQAYH